MENERTAYDPNDIDSANDPIRMVRRAPPRADNGTRRNYVDVHMDAAAWEEWEANARAGNVQPGSRIYDNAAYAARDEGGDDRPYDGVSEPVDDEGLGVARYTMTRHPQHHR